MIPMRLLALLALPLLGGCMLQYALFGFPAPQVTMARAAPIELQYREGPGGLVLINGRVNDRQDVAFILDTGAPVTVLIDGTRTAALGLDTRNARPLGDPDNPASPVGVIQPGFALDFDGVRLEGLAAVVVPERVLPCPERFQAVDFGGVIGADLFRRFVVEIDAKRKVVRLHEPGTTGAWTQAAALPLDMRGGHVYLQLPLKLDGATVQRADLHFDTGMNRGLALIAGSDPAIAFPADGKPRTSCFVNGKREERAGPRAAVAFGAVELADDAPTYSAPGSSVAGQRHGSVGIGLFRERRIAIDYPGKRLVLLE